jgi:hypothetical protein
LIFSTSFKPLEGAVLPNTFQNENSSTRKAAQLKKSEPELGAISARAGAYQTNSNCRGVVLWCGGKGRWRWIWQRRVGAWDVELKACLEGHRTCHTAPNFFCRGCGGRFGRHKLGAVWRPRRHTKQALNSH